MNNNVNNSSWADSGSPNTVTVGVDVAATASSSSSSSLIGRRNPRKKITKLMSIMEEGVKKVKGKGGYKKADPEAPKITRPCTECGKRFWSWKALFGHMRCHPERQWRGINPPSTLIRPSPPRQDSLEDHEVAACLLLLASGKGKDDYDDDVVMECGDSLGGHRASQKNVKGTRTTVLEDHEHLLSHRCSICLKVFSTGQALGGHKRCHWENTSTTIAPSPIDLNLPPLDDQHHHCSSSSSSTLTLDLRLGL